MARKASPNCAIARGDISDQCALGCVEQTCCENSDQGISSHLCLIQLLKRLHKAPQPGDKCGSCGTVW